MRSSAELAEGAGQVRLVARQEGYVCNPFYAALITADAPFALLNGVARRFQPDVIPFAAVPEMSSAALTQLVPLLHPGEEVYLTVEDGEVFPVQESLAVVSKLPGLQMRFSGSPEAPGHLAGVVALGMGDVEEMIALKQRAFPGFFGPRAPLLGSFFGVRDPRSGRLIAMGGERLATDRDREVSAVCTDPEHVGQGYAGRIIQAVLGHQARLGAGSILHVTAANVRALSLYQHLGFHVTGALTFVKVRRTS